MVFVGLRSHSLALCRRWKQIAEEWGGAGVPSFVVRGLDCRVLWLVRNVVSLTLDAEQLVPPLELNCREIKIMNASSAYRVAAYGPMRTW